MKKGALPNQEFINGQERTQNKSDFEISIFIRGHESKGYQLAINKQQWLVKNFHMSILLVIL